MKRLMLFFILFFLTTVALAQNTYTRDQGSRALTSDEIERVKAFKQLISEVDNKTTAQTVEELEGADYPGLSLLLKEAIAKTYVDLVGEKKVTDPKEKEWLYATVSINMAFLQFGGSKDTTVNGLHQNIRKKLRSYLPKEIFNQDGFLYTIE